MKVLGSLKISFNSTCNDLSFFFFNLYWWPLKKRWWCHLSPTFHQFMETTIRCLKMGCLSHLASEYFLFDSSVLCKERRARRLINSHTRALGAILFCSCHRALSIFSGSMTIPFSRDFRSTNERTRRKKLAQFYIYAYNMTRCTVSVSPL